MSQLNLLIFNKTNLKIKEKDIVRLYASQRKQYHDIVFHLAGIIEILMVLN